MTSSHIYRAWLKLRLLLSTLNNCKCLWNNRKHHHTTNTVASLERHGVLKHSNFMREIHQWRVDCSNKAASVTWRPQTTHRYVSSTEQSWYGINKKELRASFSTVMRRTEWSGKGVLHVLADTSCAQSIPGSKVHEANTGPIWGRQGPAGPHVGPMNLAIWDVSPINN